MALLLSTTVICLLGLIYFGSAAAFNSFTGATCICLSASFGSPVLVSLLGRRKSIQNSPYPLGRWGLLINVIFVSWMFVSFVLFSMPTQLPVTLASASVVFMGFAVISLFWYAVRGRKFYTDHLLGILFRSLRVVSLMDLAVKRMNRG